MRTNAFVLIKHKSFKEMKIKKFGRESEKEGLKLKFSLKKVLGKN